MLPTDALDALHESPARAAEIARTVPESQWLDRKSARIAPKDLAETLIAFANAEGGIVLLGIRDRRVEGTDALPESVRSAWRQAGLDFAVPPLRTRVHAVPCVDDRGQADHLLVIEVEPSLAVHATGRDEVFLRVGDENRRLSFAQRLELVYEKGQASFEANVLPDSSVDELDPSLIDAYAARLGHLDPARLLRARGLTTAGGQLTVAGALLFAREPQVHLPVALVRVLVYRGGQRGSGAGQQLAIDERCEGPIPRQVARAKELVEAHIPQRRALTSAGRFGEVDIVPSGAWLEGLVNAVVHRSYSNAGDHVRVEVFADRVEVESPGRFPGLVRIEPVNGHTRLRDPLAIDRFARNPRIARVCSDLGLGQELGEGIRRIYAGMREAGLVDPIYLQTAGSVHLRLLSEPREATSGAAPSARAVLDVLRGSGPRSTGELVTETGLARPTVLVALRSLEALGVVEWRGKSTRDPRARWHLTSD